jgi:hypothetical protein
VHRFAYCSLVSNVIPYIPVVRRLAMNYTETELYVLTARVEKLEAQNRHWRLAGSLIALFGISFVLMGAKSADHIDPRVVRATTIETRDLILKDQEGKVCARLSVTPIIDRVNDHMAIMSGPDGPDRAVLEIYNEKGRVVWTAPPSPSLVEVTCGPVDGIGWLSLAGRRRLRKVLCCVCRFLRRSTHCRFSLQLAQPPQFQLKLLDHETDHPHRFMIAVPNLL